ncbi:hypothetical protein BJX61DRAFT_325311 [Aspergillus egyptiacus]|nr:hypothetical protein BJX61DRAFT_325311 [Aspergillus egyptiacus]
MPDSRAIIILHPVGVADTFGYRWLKFTSESDQIEIGRASKRESKNLAPALDNALFDSRVMSRRHAILSVSLQTKLAYITDPGSMHGTWLNKKKLLKDERTILLDGDVLTLGVEVVRGPNTFPPLAVRCEFRWLEHTPVPSIGKEAVIPKQTQTSNTFCVPDAEDDECEITAHNQVSFDLTGDHDSGSGASGDDMSSRDDRSVMQVPSPMTSPLKSVDSKIAPTAAPSMVRAPESAPESAQQPAALTSEHAEKSPQPLATPRMTPSSVDYASEDPSDDESQYYDRYFAHLSNEISDVESIGPKGLDENVQDNAAESSAHQPLERDAQATAEPVPHIIYEAEVTKNLDSFETPISLKNVAQPEEQTQPQPARVGYAYDSGTRSQNPKNQALAARLSDMDSQREILNPNFCSGPLSPLHCSVPFGLRPGSSLPAGSLTNLHEATCAPSLVDKLPTVARHAFLTRYPSVPYTDGPFASSQPGGDTEPPRATTAADSSKTDFAPFLDSYAPMAPLASCDTSIKPSATKLTSHAFSELDTDSEPISLRKRKAAEMEWEPAEDACPEASDALPTKTWKTDDATDLSVEEAALPDAQPQRTAAALDGPDTQLTTLSISEDPKKVGPPSKRVKTSHTGSIGSHAAVAALGAVVGAVGAVAALASLPADYFA